ncbi:MAG: hypothetical protein ABIH34_04435 [Nanoarchaeota archaeon]
MSKRGQLTIFIILGLIIVFSILLFIYLRENTDIFDPEDIVPAWVQPLYVDVENCLGMLGEGGIQILALRGGYIELPDAFIDPRATMPLMDIIKVPLWNYRGRDYMPTREEMGEELGRYIDAHINECLDGFEPHKDRWNIEIIKGPSTAVTVGDRQVVLELSYPIKITNKGNTESTEIEEYFYAANVSLGRMHDLATEIVQKQREEGFLEEFTMQVIAASDLPMEGFELTCSPRTWSIRRDIKPLLKDLLKYNLHFINFVGTDRIPSDEAFFEKNFAVQLDDAYPDIRVTTDATFNDDWWIDLSVSPGSGDSVKALNYGLPLIGSCLKIYHHRYTMRYPLLFQLVDNGGFTFNFATPVSIRNNQPYAEQVYSEPITEELGIFDDEYCADAVHRTDIRARDEYHDEYISEAEISFRCVRAVCPIGETRRPFIGDTTIEQYGVPPLLAADLPACINGLVIGQKEGYMNGYGFLDTYESTDHAITVDMTPLQSYEFEVRIVEYPGGEVRRKLADETAIITLTHAEKNFDRTIVDGEAELMLGDYTYDLLVQVTDEDSLVGMLTADWRPESLEGYKIIFYAISQVPTPTTDEGMISFWENVDGHSAEHLPRIV